MVTGETKWHVRLARSQERILQVWEAETRERLSGAVPDSRAILRDALPLFLGRVALALAPGGKLARIRVIGYAGTTIQGAEVITEADALAELTIEDLPA